MKCTNCGREIANDSVFCEFCGTKVQKPEVVQIEKDKPKHNKAKPIIISFVIIAILGVAIYIILEQQEEKRRLEYEMKIAQQQADEEAAARAIDDSLRLVRLQEERDNARRLELEKEAAEEARKKAEEEALYAQQREMQAREAQKKAEREVKNVKEEKTITKTITVTNNNRKFGVTVNGQILTVTDNNFSDFISMSYQIPVIIDFYGSWCSWCVKMSPIIENIAQKWYYGKIVIGQYHISRNFDEKMLKKYNITGIPHLLFFQNGRIVHEVDGYTDEDEMLGLINTYFD